MTLRCLLRWTGGTLACCHDVATPQRGTVMKALNGDQVDRWKHDGFLSPFPLLNENELQTCREGLRRFEQWLGGPVNKVAEMKWRTMPYLLMPWAAKLAKDPRILDVVEDLLGPDLLI